MMTYSFCPTCNNPLMGSDGVDYDCSQCGFRQPLALPEEPPCETCNGDGYIDERLGGYAFSNPKAQCPDCDGDGTLPPAPTEASRGAK